MASQWQRDPAGAYYCILDDGRRITYEQYQAYARQEHLRLQRPSNEPRTLPPAINISSEQSARQRAPSDAQPGYDTRRSAEASGSAGPVNPLNQSYKTKNSSWFQRYRVLLILWHENAGEDVTVRGKVTVKSVTRDGTHNEPIFSKIRRFVVLGVAERHCICVPIQTYRGKGISKKGVDPKHHAVAFTGVERGLSIDERRTSGVKSMQNSIRIDQDNKAEMLDPMSRINYAEVYTVQYNVKVAPYGNIHPHYRQFFDQDCWKVLGPILFPDIAAHFPSSLSGVGALAAALPPVQTGHGKAPMRNLTESSQASSSKNQNTRDDDDDDEEDEEEEEGEEDDDDEDEDSEGEGED